MKKTYMTPAVKAVNVKAATILAGSITSGKKNTLQTTVPEDGYGDGYGADTEDIL